MKTFTLFFGLLLLACKSGENPVSPPPVTSPPESAVTLKGTAPFPMGASVDPTLLITKSAYRDRVIKEHNSITAENAMKWGWLHPSETTFNFKDADAIVAFAEQNKMRVHGHTLLWHTGNPTWLNNVNGDSLAWENLMKTHIQIVAEHFRGKVTSWDVVNEAFHDNGTLRSGYDSDNSIWAAKLGSDYIARAFRYAAAADPNALLFYNDYDQESKPGKLQAAVNLVNDFKKRGIPIHGIGLQMHIGLGTDLAGIETALKTLAATGLKIHMSELDINMSNFQKNPNLRYTDALAQQQREKYRQVVSAYKRLVPPAQQFGITNWNVGDGDSWIRQVIQPNDWPLPFDEGYLRKPAWFGIVDGLKE
jgi:endo-1,4-beta-xylanase